MITFTGTKLICECGNETPKKFDKFIGIKNVKTEKGYLHSIKYEAVICRDCNEIITDEELGHQIIEINKKRDEENAQKALQNPIPVRVGVG